MKFKMIIIQTSI